MKNKINFLCVGVQKAGTSTLHDILSQNPFISLPEIKETHFFRDDSSYELGAEHYFKTYFGKDAQVLGEVDPEYAYFEESAQRIKKTLGTVKIIFLLRNPVDRSHSHFLMTRRRGYEEMNYLEAIKEEKNRLTSKWNQIHYSYISRGKYSEQIQRFIRVFGKENVQIYLFEEFIKNPSKMIKSISEFIGIPKYNYNYNLKSNPASEAKSKILRDFIYQPNKIKKWGGKLFFSKKMKSRTMVFLNKKNLKPSKKINLTDNQKKQVYNDFFVKEIKSLEIILDRSLDIWKYE